MEGIFGGPDGLSFMLSVIWLSATAKYQMVVMAVIVIALYEGSHPG